MLPAILLANMCGLRFLYFFKIYVLIFRFILRPRAIQNSGWRTSSVREPSLKAVAWAVQFGEKVGKRD